MVLVVGFTSVLVFGLVLFVGLVLVLFVSAMSVLSVLSVEVFWSLLLCRVWFSRLWVSVGLLVFGVSVMF